MRAYAARRLESLTLFRGALAAVEISLDERHSHEVGDIVRLHLLNDGGSVMFGRSRADARLVSHELGRQPLQKKGKHLPLALRQQRQPRIEFLHFLWSVLSVVAERQGFL